MEKNQPYVHGIASPLERASTRLAAAAPRLARLPRVIVAVGTAALLALLAFFIQESTSFGFQGTDDANIVFVYARHLLAGLGPVYAPLEVDENLPLEIALSLREAGHDALTVLDQGLGGHTDGHVVEVCKRERRALVTLDTDFANLQVSSAEYSGLLVLRLQRLDKPHVLAAFQRIMPLLETEPLERKLWIVDEHRVRLRD
jgi:predicted nuclease of predicted toxin-antitoxin system